MCFKEMVKLRNVLPCHVCTLSVQHPENRCNVGVFQRVPSWEHLAADDGVKMVASAPEAPLSAKVRDTVDGVGCLSRGVCTVGLASLSRVGMVR